jgi:hypothetical protein
VIALGTALVGPDTSSPWLWLAETGVTIALTSVSWRFIETPIMRNGLRATVRQLRQLQRIAGPGRELVLVSTFGPQAWEHVVNTALAAAARHSKHTELADWHQAIAGRTSLLWPDGIHPCPARARLYARVVLAAIKAGLTSDQRQSCPASPSGSA